MTSDCSFFGNRLVLLGAVAVFVILFFGCFSCSSTRIFAAEDGRENSRGNSADTGSDTQKKQEDENDGKKTQTPRPTHNHPAFAQRSEERAEMVEKQIHSRRIKDPNVLNAVRTVPRHAFVRKTDISRAYKDHPLPIGLGQTISQPYIVAYMTEKLELKPHMKVLEVGTGSGYQAAVCAEIAKEVYTIEILKKLADSAKERLKKLGYRNVFVKDADGYFGWKEKAPFDVVIVTAAAGVVPPVLIDQLKAGGKMILPLGSPYGYQSLVLITKDDENRIHSRRLLPVRFVPMVGRVTEDN